MSEFKAMKFWIGDDPACSERVQKMLFDMGYVWSYQRDTVIRHTNGEFLHTGGTGIILQGNRLHQYQKEDAESINIDWLRTPKQETIELNGKNYIKADVEAALEKLKPVEEK